ncbi:MAG: hypothetical protein AAFQ43_08990 [Bacteroidota bacterium]
METAGTNSLGPLNLAVEAPEAKWETPPALPRRPLKASGAA